MPKVEKIKDNVYKYKCECGCEITYDCDFQPDKELKKVFKCFKCQEKIKWKN